MLYTALTVLLVMLVAAVPVTAGLGWLGLILDGVYSPFSMRAMMGQVAWSTSTSYLLITIPFYVMLGEILLKSGIAARMYNAIAPAVSWLPGGLMHSNVAVSGMFAAVSGSSAATAITIGTVAMEQVEKRGYNERLFLGTIVAGGTLGILIPPSINLVIYGVITETSIPQLYLAGIVPGALLMILFMATVLVICLIRPNFGGNPMESTGVGLLKVLPDLIRPVVIFVAVIGSIYGGFATPTEAAALGILIALILTAMDGALSLRMLLSVLESTMRTTGLIMAILIASYFLNVVITMLGIPRALASAVATADLGRTEIILIVIALYLVVGMFMETLSMMIATVPITAPIVIAAGWDPIWFGILVVLLMETALLTPPVGMNLFIVQGIRPRGDLRDVIIGSLPFLVALLLMVALVTIAPSIVLWLPSLLP